MMELLTKANGNLDRIAVAANYGFTAREIYLARDAWRKLYDRAPASTITFKAYLDLMKDAGLRPSMVGLRRGQYQLARLKDTGAYDIGNCRFIPQEINQRERRRDYQSLPANRAKARQHALTRIKKKCAQCGSSVSPGMYARWHGDKCNRSKGETK